MPQEFHVLRCYSCSVFQVHFVKKSNKWQCKMCNEKQSLKKVYGVGTGKDCRLHVQKLNSLHLVEQEQAAGGSIVNQLSTASSHPLEDESPSQYFTSEYEEQEHAQNIPETSGQSKWDRYIEEKPQQDSESDSEEPLRFEKPAKRRRVQPQSAQFTRGLDKKCAEQKETFLPSKSVPSKQLSQQDTRAGNAFGGNSNFGKGKWGKYVTNTQNSENGTANSYINSTIDQNSSISKYSVNNLSPSVSDDNIPQEIEDKCADYSNYKSTSTKTAPNRWSKYLDNFPQPQNSTVDHPESCNLLHSNTEKSDCNDIVEKSTKKPINFSITNEELSDEELDNLLQL